MSHLDEATLVALRDGEAHDGRSVAERHLESCPECREALAAAHARRDLIAGALASLDEPFDPAAARRIVRARARAAGAESPRFAQRVLRRAAAVTLLLAAAGGAYAMPGSPVRSWLSGSGDTRPTRPPSTPQGRPTVTSEVETGVHLDVEGGPLRVVLRGVEAGTEIYVRLVAGTTASVTAPRGTRFTTSDGRIEAVTAPGTVRVEFPREARPASLLVSGHTYLRNTDTGLDVVGPSIERTATSIRFRVPAG